MHRSTSTFNSDGGRNETCVCACVVGYCTAVTSEFMTTGYAQLLQAQASERVTPGCARMGSSGQLMNLNIAAYHFKNTKFENLVWPGFYKHHHL